LDAGVHVNVIVVMLDAALHE